MLKAPRAAGILFGAFSPLLVHAQSTGRPARPLSLARAEKPEPVCPVKDQYFGEAYGLLMDARAYLHRGRELDRDSEENLRAAELSGPAYVLLDRETDKIRPLFASLGEQERWSRYEGRHVRAIGCMAPPRSQWPAVYVRLLEAAD